MEQKRPDSLVIDFQQAKAKRSLETGDQQYQRYVSGMTRLELLEEMVRFQEARTKAGTLTMAMMVRGKILFTALELVAETDELRILAGSYRRHLDHEIQHRSRATN